jgi:triosephosphate isomerase (TIM)
MQTNSFTKLIVANWKSNKTAQEADHWMDEFKHVRVPDSGRVVITPSFPLLPTVQLATQTMKNVAVGTQTISTFSAGSYTGAVSARNLLGFDVTHAIVGHSEQRRYFHTTNQDVARQVDQCLINDIVPIVCIDENELARQADAIPSDQLRSCVVAYEPVDAIGSGNNAPVDEVREMHDRIRVVFGNVPVLYGGSVNPSNAAEYALVADGFIVGTASLDVHEFIEVVKKTL